MSAEELAQTFLRVAEGGGVVGDGGSAPMPGLPHQGGPHDVGRVEAVMGTGIGHERDVAAGGAGILGEVATQLHRGPVVRFAVQYQEGGTSAVRRDVATVRIERHE